MRFAVIIAILCAGCSVMLGMGIRQSFGLFLRPMSEAMGTGREAFSLAVAISNLVYGLPFVGVIADKIGPRWVIIIGSLLYGLGLWLMTTITTPIGLNISLGLVVGIALSGTTFVVVLGAVAPLIPPEQRSRTFGIITSIGSSGMFIIPPLAQLLLDSYGWQRALTILAFVALSMILLAFGLPSRAAIESQRVESTEVEEPFVQMLRRAGQHSGYLILIAGFFVCGFHVAFIAVHLPAFLKDYGLPSMVAAGALSMIGAFNMIGSFLFGWLGDQYRKKYLLSFIYFGRAVVIVIFLLLPITRLSALIFGGAMGFLWLATVPLTSGAVAQIFGTRYLSTLFGVVFFSHQVGAFLGVWLGGRLYDSTGSYDLIWYASIALGIFAALVHLPMTDQPAAKLQPAS